MYINSIQWKFIMKLKLILFSIILLLIQPAFAINKIIFFGDSLSDSGNFYRDVLGYMPKDPPYYKGKFSNGQVWSEYVAQYFSDKNNIETANYAIGGQTAFLHNPFEGYLPYTLSMSYANYILHSAFSDRSSTLFVIWIGANDYLPNVDNGDQLSDNVVNSIQTIIENLIYHGGNNFLLLNLPDLASTPFGQASSYKEKLKTTTQAHNLKMEKMLSTLQGSYKNINIHLFDINQFFAKAIANPEEYNKKYNTHITNVKDSCWSGGYSKAKRKLTRSFITEKINSYNRSQIKFTSSVAHTDELAEYIYQSPALLEGFKMSNYKEMGLKPCENPDSYIFWDKVHPGSVPHKIIAQELIEFISVNYKT